MSTTSKAKPRVELLCRSLVTLKGGKLGYEFRRVLIRDTDEGKDVMDTAPLCYGKIKRGACRVGSVYSFEAPEDGGFDDPERRTLHLGSMRWERGWWNKDEAATWDAVATANGVAHDASRRRDKDEGEAGMLRAALAPVRRAYRATNCAGQAAIIAAVIMELQRYGSREDE